MVQEELIRTIADNTKISHSNVKAVLSELGNQVATIRPGGELRTTIIGTFSVTHQSARVGRNPRTGEPAEIEAKNVMKFKPAKHIRDAINA